MHYAKAAEAAPQLLVGFHEVPNFSFINRNT